VEVGTDGERGGTVGDEDGITVHRLGARMPFHAPFNPVAGPRATGLLLDLQPDVVHVHAGIMSPFANGVAKSAMALGMPVAITWHCMLDHSRLILRPWAWITGWRGAPAALSAVSARAAAEVARIFGGPVSVLHDGIDQASWSPPHTLSPLPPPLRCVAASRLVAKKGLGALVKAVAEAADDLPRGAITLDIFGDGPDRWRIEQLVKRGRLEDVVTLRGRVSHTELHHAYGSAHVFCGPAGREAFGIAGLEARANGLVIVGRRGNGFEEFVTPGHDSVLVDDVREMGRALVRLASDTDWYVSLRDRARTAIPEFDYQRVALDTFAEYERAQAVGSGVIARS
jgi:glycosyltransferase involved in cell wall biosynthesis